MNPKEEIKVFARIEKGKTVCICPASDKKCKAKCTRDVVVRDKFRGWESTFRRNRYGK